MGNSLVQLISKSRFSDNVTTVEPRLVRSPTGHENLAAFEIGVGPNLMKWSRLGDVLTYILQLHF